MEIISNLLEELFDEKMNREEVARHPDSIYNIKLKTDIDVPEYSMLKVVRRKNEFI